MTAKAIIGIVLLVLVVGGLIVIRQRAAPAKGYRPYTIGPKM